MEKKRLQVLIVDDEAVLREGMRTIIPWEEYGFEVCATAANGLEGLHILRERRPEVAVVDIRMPLVDGLEVCRRVREEALGTRILLLTGYSEFEYARSALRCGVKGYLLKPVEEQELVQELTAIREELQAERERQQLLKSGSELLLGQLIHEILHHPAGEQPDERLNRLYQAGFPWMSYQVLLARARSGRDIGDALQELSQREKIGLAFLSEDAPGILIRDRLLEASGEEAQKLCRTLEERAGEPCLISLGTPCDKISDIPLSYESAASLMAMTFWTPHTQLLDSSLMDEYLARNAQQYEGNLISDLIHAVRAADAGRLREFIGSIKSNLLLFDMPATCARAVYANILVSVYSALDTGEGEGERGSLLFDIYQINQEIAGKSSIREVEDYTLEKLLSWMNRRAARKMNARIQPVLQYIEENLDKDLRLEQLARRFGYNSAYLGKLFRDCTGEYFNGYVDRLKMEKAKEYIREGCLVYEAAQRVGYSNINYFYIKFKKYTGVSPGALKKEPAEKPAGRGLPER